MTNDFTPASEPVAYLYRVPICDANGALLGYSEWKISTDESGGFLSWWPNKPLYTSEALQKEREAGRRERDAEVANLKTVMIAAAEEIQRRWWAHCDDEGYGPANLMRRLEEGIPSEYGYTAGEFARLREQLEMASSAFEREQFRADAADIRAENAQRESAAEVAELVEALEQCAGQLRCYDRTDTGAKVHAVIDAVKDADAVLAKHSRSKT